jgi:hypothetical protein
LSRCEVGVVFKLTKQEQMVVAFLVGAILLGTAVKHWRTQQEEAARANMETREH